MTEQRENCFFCNGFYGPTHGEYICGTCHLFLYAEEINPNQMSSVANPATDENDSGNDEPSEGQLNNERVINCRAHEIQDDELPSSSATVNSIQRSLYQRVNELSVAANDDLEKSQVDHLVRLSPEVLLIIIRYLDNLSLWNLAIACPYVRDLINTASERWHASVSKYWPLYKPLYKEDWYNIFSKLVISAPCKSCLGKMINDIDGKTVTDLVINEIDNSRRINRLKHEIKIMQLEPPEGVNARPFDKDYLYWSASIQGPANSPYEGGIFFLYIQFPHVYPLLPPKIRFITKIFHPNVSRHGDIGLDCIAHNWSLALTISKILISIQSLLTDPYCRISMEPAIAELYESNRLEFNRKAMDWSRRYAMADILPMNPDEIDNYDETCT